MNKPTRVQRTRKSKLPPNTFCCTRHGGKKQNPYANPFVVVKLGGKWTVWSEGVMMPRWFGKDKQGAVKYAVARHKQWIIDMGLDLEPLRQYTHLACWCPVGDGTVCHVDNFLEML